MNTNTKKSAWLDWIDLRFPLSKTIREHLTEYYAPKNFNFWYFFGSLALVVFANQIITGVWLVMFYTPTAKEAFDSVEYIMRDVHYGWLLRYLHSTGASFFFIVIYLHMLRGMLYGSYKKPRELLWLIGMLLFILLLAEAFCGYLLPWGQMSFWGAQVITSLFGAIPWVGDQLIIWLRGDFGISDVSLHRFFSLHVVAIPVLMMGLVFVHLIALHKVGSNNPDGIEIKNQKNNEGIPLDGIPFHPYYTVKDTMGVVVFLIAFSSVLFFFPTVGGYFLEYANFQPANPMVTPAHIAPVWYMTPFYSILRAIPNKLFGVIAMASSVAFLFVIPWLDRSPVKSMRYRGWWSRGALVLFILCFLALGYLGTIPVTPIKQLLAQIASGLYFAFFVLMPFYTTFEKTKTPPERVRM